VNECLGLLADQSGLIGIAQTFETALRQRIGIVVTGQVQQPDFDAGIGDLSGDAGSHGAGADNGDFFDAHE